jgi:proprotein convertase subtilisin/kexin type 5
MVLSGQNCSCPSSCSNCSVAATNCLSCTFDPNGVLTACSSCSSGFEVAPDGVSCTPCALGCATCQAGSCLSCLPTFILSGSLCSCESALKIFIYNSEVSCRHCEDIFYGCTFCTTTGATTSCSQCQEGMFLNGSTCAYCSPICLGCSSHTVCTSCPSGLTPDGSGNCVCGVDCANCAASIPSCSQCVLTIMGAFASCTACDPGSYLLNSSTCATCPTGCVTCDNQANCTSCTATLEVMVGNCGCDPNKGLWLIPLSGLC